MEGAGVKILLSNNFYHPNVLGGAEISTQTLAETLVQRGHSVRMLCLSGDAETRRFEHNGVRVTALGRKIVGTGPVSDARSPLGRLAWHISAAQDFGWGRSLRAAIAEDRPDLVHSFNLAGLTTRLWSAVKAEGLPLVHTLFGTYLVCYRGPMFRNGRDCGTQCASCELLTRRRRGDSRLVNVVTGDSRAVLDRHLENGYFPAATERLVVNCGFRQDGAAPPAERAPHTGPLRIGFLGRLHPTKGLDVLLDACNRLSGTDWQLRIGGSGSAEQEERLRNLGNPRITFLGWQKTTEFLAGIDVMVVPSIWNDPLPRVVFESFCAGVPVIGSRIGGIPEMVEEGATGHLVTPASAEELATALDQLIASPQHAAAMRAACLARAGHFTADRFADDYLALYARLLGETGRNLQKEGRA
jgi:glycosyltransferase involved in cell wall biosynthesis